jgi:hypothetical protein
VTCHKNMKAFRDPVCNEGVIQGDNVKVFILCLSKFFNSEVKAQKLHNFSFQNNELGSVGAGASQCIMNE